MKRIMEAFEKEEMTTMASCTNRLQKEGYKENFVAKNNGLHAPSSGKTYSPSEIKVSNFYRFEGESDPADNSILYAIETSDGLKGILIDAYGASSNANISKFMKDVENITKKEHVPTDEKVGDK